jgi:hypothetical protein
MAETDGVDQVLLQGTFNGRASRDERQAILAEAWRILRPGGRLTLHQLTAKTSLDSLAAGLPGPAAVVERVPSAAELAVELQQAGFVELYFDKLDEGPCFMADGVECRETRLSACKPLGARGDLPHQVLYKGPFREVLVDPGQRFARGEWSTVDAATLERLSSGPLADQFVIEARRAGCE